MGLFDFLKEKVRYCEMQSDPLGEKKHVPDDKIDSCYERAIPDDPIDPLYECAIDVIFETQQPSVSMLQRKLKLSYGRAAKLMDMMENDGIVSPFDNVHPRKILVSSPQIAKTMCRKPKKPQIQQIQKPQLNVSLASVDSMEGHEFEHWCAELLRQNGFSNIEVTRGSGDQGVDIVATKGGVRYAIQCKCYSSPLGNKPVQEVHAGKNMYKCHVGVVMTNSHFTSGAKELADATGVLLWDRDTLQAMMAEAAKLGK